MKCRPHLLAAAALCALPTPAVAGPPFGAALAVVALLYYATKISRVALFWAAFILTRPLGATVGDFLDKPLAKGGLDLSRPIASLVLAGAIVILIVVLPQRAGGHPGSTSDAS